ncbi:MAG TPA: hypothetical protein VJP87_12040, partial [Candidatus Acidoferrales bacterium]|nr:hypothetical protein [Candidatus Acidoferrales bacterium]
MTTYTQIDSPIGPLLLAASEMGLSRIDFMTSKRAHSPAPDWRENATPLQATIRQLRAYFAGK